jgi:hypothetical protein
LEDIMPEFTNSSPAGADVQIVTNPNQLPLWRYYLLAPVEGIYTGPAGLPAGPKGALATVQVTSLSPATATPVMPPMWLRDP